MSTAGVTVVVVPRAKANGPLHLGDLGGPYLAADLAARAVRARGERVMAVAGFDVHQKCVLTSAETDGVDVDKLVAAYKDEIVDALAAARIEYDVLLDPQSKEYQHGVATLAADVTEAGRFPLRRLTLLACEECGRTACSRCGGRPRPFRARVPVLSMEDYRQELIEIWLRAELSDHARQIVTRYLDRRLPDVPMAYPTNWGIAGLGPHEGLRLDAYAEIGLSTVYGVAQSLRPGALGLEEAASAWSEVGSLWHFIGIDDVFYCALFWPAVYLACGVPPETISGAQVNELPTHAICANDFLHDEDVQILRLYLAWNGSSEFTLPSYREFETHIRPLLNRTTRQPALPTALAVSDAKRALAALHPHTFNPPLAARSLLTAPAAELPESKQLLSILTGL